MAVSILNLSSTFCSLHYSVFVHNYEPLVAEEADPDGSGEGDGNGTGEATGSQLRLLAKH